MNILRSPELLNRKFIEYLAPTLFMNISLAITNLVNTAIVGHFLGSDALAAVNLCMPAFCLANAVFNTVIVGACTLIVAEKGAMHSRRVNQIFTQLAIVGLVIMIAINLAILLFLHPLATLFMGGVDNPSMRTQVLAYLFPLAFSFPFVFIALGGSMVLRTDGHPRYGAFVVLAANIGNLIADFLFICVLGMGVAGAAWATMASFVFGSLLVMPYFFLRSRTLRFCWLGRDLLRGFSTVILTGLPSGCTSMLVFARILLLNTLIFRLFGSGGAAAFAICAGLQYFANMFLLGVTGAMQPVSAMLFGEKDYSGLKNMLRTALWEAVSIMMFFALAFFFFPDFLGSLYGLQGAGRGFLPQALTALAMTLPFCAVNYFYLTYCQTIKRLALGLTISVASSFGFIAILAPLFYFVFPHHFWFILPAAEIATTLLLGVIIAFLCLREKVSWLLVRDEPLPIWECSVRYGWNDASSLVDSVVRFACDHGIESDRAKAVGSLIGDAAQRFLQGSEKKEGRVAFDIIVKVDQGEITGRFRIAKPSGSEFDFSFVPISSEEKSALRPAMETSVSQTLGFHVIFFKTVH